jgi:O-antigen ligase
MRRITYWLAVALIFIIPWEDSITVEILGSLARLIGFVVAAFWMATILLEGEFRRPHLIHFFALLFFLWNFMTLFWSTDTANTIQRIKTYSQIFLLMLIFWEVFKKPEDLRTGLQAYVYGAYVPIISTISNYINGNVATPYEGRYTATGVNAVDLALILIMGLPFAMHLFFTSSQNKQGAILKLINLAYIPSAIFSIILTGSRTSLLAVIPFGFYLILTQQIKLGPKLLVFGILFMSLLALLPFVPQTVIARLGTLGTSLETGDLSGRVDLWRDAIAIFSRHPFLGLGSGSLDLVIGSAAHNTFISVAAETGFIGFVLFFTVLALAFFQIINISNGNSGLWATVFLSWVIGVGSLSWEFRKLTWLFLNFIVIERSLIYAQPQIKQAKMKFSKGVKRFFDVTDPKAKTEGGR